MEILIRTQNCQSFPAKTHISLKLFGSFLTLSFLKKRRRFFLLISLIVYDWRMGTVSTQKIEHNKLINFTRLCHLFTTFQQKVASKNVSLILYAQRFIPKLFRLVQFIYSEK